MSVIIGYKIRCITANKQFVLLVLLCVRNWMSYLMWSNVLLASTVGVQTHLFFCGDIQKSVDHNCPAKKAFQKKITILDQFPASSITPLTPPTIIIIIVCQCIFCRIKCNVFEYIRKEYTSQTLYIVHVSAYVRNTKVIPWVQG